jgi:plasmid stabilization system protein ParE
MKRSVVDIHPEAILEGRDARDWYFSKSAQAEEAFRIELERAIRLIREAPETWPRYLHGTRRFIFTAFPNSLVYTTDGSLLTGDRNRAREPKTWLLEAAVEVG